MPLYLTYFVTNRCNLYCEHCFYSASLNQPVEELSLEEIEKITESLDPFPVLLLSGGEPFLRKDLPEVVAAFARNCKINYLNIPTNGLLMKPTTELTARICELCPDTSVVISFSLDGLEEEHNAIRGSKRSFANAIKSYHEVKALKAKYSNLKVGFVTTMTQTNQDTMDKLYDYLIAQKPDNISVNLIRGVPRNPRVKNIDLSKFQNITRRIENDLKNGVLPGHDDFLAAMGAYKYGQIIKTVRDDRYLSTCYASQIAGVIYPDGDVYPCELLDESKKIGNLREFDLNFRRLWLSDRNREIIKWIQDSKCYCTHECNVHCNTAFNPGHFTQIAGSAVVQRIKRALRF